MEESGKSEVPRQPQVVAVWDTVMSAKDYYFLFDEVIYHLDSLVNTVKIFFVFNADYPAEAADVCTFLQKGVYGITTPYDVLTPRDKELLELLQAM